MNQNKKFWGRLRSLRNVTAILAVGFAMTGGVISLLGGDALQWLVFAVGFLGVDALVERLDMLSNIEENVKSGLMLVDKTSSSVILEFLLKEAQHAGGRSNDKRLQRFLYLDVYADG